MKPIKISEIFYSIQGEGFHTGTPAVFIRTAGCNLACDFCDTDFSLTRKMSIEDILKFIAPFPARYIILTGGEPTLQASSLANLVTALHQKKYFVALETNGTSLVTFNVDWITVSPKIANRGKWLLKKGNELKLLYSSQDLSFFENSQFDHFFLQPIEIKTKAGKRDEKETHKQIEKTIKAVKENPKWKLSIQLHKEIGIK